MKAPMAIMRRVFSRRRSKNCFPTVSDLMPWSFQGQVDFLPYAAPHTCGGFFSPKKLFFQIHFARSHRSPGYRRKQINVFSFMLDVVAVLYCEYDVIGNELCQF